MSYDIKEIHVSQKRVINSGNFEAVHFEASITASVPDDETNAVDSLHELNGQLSEYLAEQEANARKASANPMARDRGVAQDGAGLDDDADELDEKPKTKSAKKAAKKSAKKAADSDLDIPDNLKRTKEKTPVVPTLKMQSMVQECVKICGKDKALEALHKGAGVKKLDDVPEENNLDVFMIAARMNIRQVASTSMDKKEAVKCLNKVAPDVKSVDDILDPKVMQDLWATVRTYHDDADDETAADGNEKVNESKLRKELAMTGAKYFKTDPDDARRILQEVGGAKNIDDIELDNIQPTIDALNDAINGEEEESDDPFTSKANDGDDDDAASELD